MYVQLRLFYASFNKILSRFLSPHFKRECLIVFSIRLQFLFGLLFAFVHGDSVYVSIGASGLMPPQHGQEHHEPVQMQHAQNKQHSFQNIRRHLILCQFSWIVDTLVGVVGDERHPDVSHQNPLQDASDERGGGAILVLCLQE